MVMVESIIVIGVGEILKKVISMATPEIGLLWNVEDELEKLVDTLTAIQALLQDAEKQQEEKETVRLFLGRLRDVAYAADNILDEFNYQTTRLKVTKNMVSRIFLHSISSVFKLKMAHKIKNINTKLDETKRIMDSFSFVKESIPIGLQNKKIMETFSFVDESKVVGRDEEKSRIVNILTISDNQDILLVLPIVGMGGLGKTTLAKLVYNDGLVDKYFDKKVWVHVSKDFDIKKLLTDIIESVTNKPCQFSSADVIQRNLKDELGEKRFLLVLDDIWNVTSEQWDMLTISLKIGARGSKIITTTRSDEVASMIDTLGIQLLKMLSDDECWSILKNKAFGNGGVEETPNMVAIGKEIAKKCGGVPLAAKTLGGLMHIKKDEQEWLSIEDSEIWALPMDKDGILPALKLSYDHLPSPLKQCFLYCSIFPKGGFIPKNSLIQQWMALGFLQPSIEDRSMEDVGNDYCNYLLGNSFFHNPEKDHYGDIFTFKMHDLVFDLAYSLSRIEHITLGEQELKKNSNVFHLSLSYTNGDIKKFQKCLSKMSKLRSLCLTCSESEIFDYSTVLAVLDVIFKKLKHLRVLDLSDCKFEELPSSIKKLKHLRYLNLNNNSIEELPAVITKLYNLQALNLYNCPLKGLPQDMQILVNLRQLIISREYRYLSQMPIEMGRLIHLKYLSTFVVGDKSGQSIKELQCLDLGRVIEIFDLQKVRSRKEAEEANLMGKEKLLELKLSWASDWDGDSSSKLGNDDVLEGLRPHPNLKFLSINNFRSENFPGWMMSGCRSFLPNLVRLILNNCRRLERVPPLGQLPSLKYFHLVAMTSMKSLGNDLYHHEGDRGSNNYGPEAAANAITTITSTLTTLFPSLEELSLENMPNLEEWVEPQQHPQGSFFSFPRLERIFVINCPKLMIMPTQFPSLKQLQINGSNGDLLKFVAEVPSLIMLEIMDVPKLQFLPKGLLHNKVEHLYINKCWDLEAIVTPTMEDVEVLPSSLELLMVRNCPSLTSLPNLQGLHFIRKFILRNNEKITQLPEGLRSLHTLEYLNIGRFSSELESFPDLEPLQHLPSLRYLIIIGWSKLASLPEQLQNLTQLEKLGIYHFERVVALPEWLGNLSSLRQLYLGWCHDLMYLPKEEGLRCLTALQMLIIINCSLLEERCTEQGEEWPKIKHIPRIGISND